MRLGASGFDIYPELRTPVRRRVEKTRAGKALDNDDRSENTRANLNPATRVTRRESRSGTRSESVTCQNGVTCGFAAQILGQILGTNKADSAAVVNAYARQASISGDARLIRYA